jgi:hypothetical protein
MISAAPRRNFQDFGETDSLGCGFVSMLRSLILPRDANSVMSLINHCVNPQNAPVNQAHYSQPCCRIDDHQQPSGMDPDPPRSVRSGAARRLTSQSVPQPCWAWQCLPQSPTIGKTLTSTSGKLPSLNTVTVMGFTTSPSTTPRTRTTSSTVIDAGGPVRQDRAAILEAPVVIPKNALMGGSRVARPRAARRHVPRLPPSRPAAQSGLAGIRERG